ncbi:MAG: hypothetical protein ACK5YO_21275, partial [Planctomyces sp.]
EVLMSINDHRIPPESSEHCFSPQSLIHHQTPLHPLAPSIHPISKFTGPAPAFSSVSCVHPPNSTDFKEQLF